MVAFLLIDTMIGLTMLSILIVVTHKVMMMVSNNLMLKEVQFTDVIDEINQIEQGFNDQLKTNSLMLCKKDVLTHTFIYVCYEKI